MFRARRRLPKLGHHGALHHKPHLRNTKDNTSLFDSEQPFKPIGQRRINGQLSFAGSCVELFKQCSSWSADVREEVKTLEIFPKETLLQKENKACIIIVFVVGMLFCGIPWLLLLFDSFQLRFRSLFQTEDTEYKAIADIVGMLPKLTSAKITLRDNTINEHKLRFIVEGCRSISLQIVNNCRALNLYEGQVECVEEYFRSLPPKYGISFKWKHLFVVHRPTDSELALLL